jgi:hypothetical protein
VGSHSGWYNSVQPAESQPTFRRKMSSPSSGLKNKTKQETIRPLLAASFMLVSLLVYSSSPETEVTCASEMSVDFQRTARDSSNAETVSKFKVATASFLCSPPCLSSSAFGPLALKATKLPHQIMLLRLKIKKKSTILVDRGLQNLL